MSDYHKALEEARTMPIEDCKVCFDAFESILSGDDMAPLMWMAKDMDTNQILGAMEPYLHNLRDLSYQGKLTLMMCMEYAARTAK